MISKTCGHRWCCVNSAPSLRKRHVGAAEIVMHREQGHGVFVVFQLLGKGIGQAGEAPHRHPHSEIRPLDVAGGDVVAVGPPHDWLLDRSSADSGAVAPLIFDWRGVNLVEYRVVHAAPSENILNSGEVAAEPVARKLDTVSDARGKITDKKSRGFAGTVANEKRGHQLGIGIKSRPRPHVTKAEDTLTFGCDVPLFTVAKRPNLVYLNPLAGQVPNALVVEREASGSDLHQQLENRPLCRSGHSGRGADRIAVHKCGEDTHPLFYAELIHRQKYA